MSCNLNDISKSIQRHIDSKLGAYRFIHYQPKDISNGLGIDLTDIVKQALKDYHLTKITHTISSISDISLTPLNNPFVLRVRYHDGYVDCFLRHTPDSPPWRLIHPHEWDQYDIKDAFILANQRSLVNGKCEKCKQLFKKLGIPCSWDKQINDLDKYTKSQPADTDKKTDVTNVLLNSLKKPQQNKKEIQTHKKKQSDTNQKTDVTHVLLNSLKKPLPNKKEIQFTFQSFNKVTMIETLKGKDINVISSIPGWPGFY